jgi:putative membrane protein
MPAGKESAEDLAEPVVVRRKAYAPVACNGPAYAPYFMSLTLWLGVLMASFLFRLIVFPRSLVGKSAAAKILGKGILPCLISCAGAVFLGVAVHQFMGIPPLHPLGLYIVLLVAALSYNAIILSMVRLVGDAGKLIAVLFLVVQIAAAGGAYSIELSPHLYRALSPYLPLTHVVRGLRAAMFGSYNGEWARGVLLLIPWMIGALGLSLLSRRRFRYVEDDDYGPALDLSFKR